MTEPALTTQELFDRIADDTLDILCRDIALGGKAQETVCKLLGNTLTMLMKATQTAPFPIRLALMTHPVKHMFEIAWEANMANLLEGAYEPKEPSDA